MFKRGAVPMLLLALSGTCLGAHLHVYDSFVETQCAKAALLANFAQSSLNLGSGEPGYMAAVHQAIDDPKVDLWADDRKLVTIVQRDASARARKGVPAATFEASVRADCLAHPERYEVRP